MRSNVIAPGPIDSTEGIARLSTKGPDGTGTGTGTGNGGWLAPTGRNGSVQDVANTAVFLFSPAARYITGQVIAVDGASEHIREFQLPYPQAVLDPASVAHLFKARL